MNKIFENKWVTGSLMMLVAIADLVALTARIEFGAGFILAATYLMLAGWRR